MGFNTVVFLLNDLMGSLKKSPNTVTHALTSPPMSQSERERRDVQSYLDSVAGEFNEPRIHSQALEVLPTFHADFVKFFRAGRNSIEELQVVRYGKDRKTGKQTVTLELPDP